MTALLFIILAGMFNAGYEIIFVAYKQSVFKNLNPQFWDPQSSWIYKWKYPLQIAPVKWYYFGFQPRYKERFPYSSSMFVWLTDAWHCMKALMLACIMLAVITYEPMTTAFLDFIILYCAFTFTFTMFYEYVFRK